jgi:hypothetical protein
MPHPVQMSGAIDPQGMGRNPRPAAGRMPVPRLLHTIFGCAGSGRYHRHSRPRRQLGPGADRDGRHRKNNIASDVGYQWTAMSFQTVSAAALRK